MADSGSERTAVTVVLPAYNEAESIRAGRLGRVLEWGALQDPPADVLVVDDGSKDETPRLAEACGAAVVRIPHGGKAAAVQAGIRAASGRWVLAVDMDQATPIEEGARLTEALASGADVAIGSRGLRRPGAPPGRFCMSLGHWFLRRALLGLRFRDTQCGFKGFDREGALRVLSHLSVYGPGRPGGPPGPCVNSGFDVEFLLVALKLGMSVREVPVRWHHSRSRRVGKLRDSWRGLEDLLAIAAASTRGCYPEGEGRERSGAAGHGCL